MPSPNTLRSRVSRETRQLLAAALVALVALWVLARIRFPDQPPSPNPIPSLLSQLSAAPRFANLAGEIAELQNRLAGSWLPVATTGADDTGEVEPRQLAAMRVRSGAAVLLLPRGDRLVNEQDVIAVDHVTGLAVIRTGDDGVRVDLPRWNPAALDSPRYLMATVGTTGGVSLRPVLVASLYETGNAAWSGPIWLVPRGTDLETGSFVFTTSGEIAGLAGREPAGLAIIPWEVVLAEAMRILDRQGETSVDFRVDVQPLTPALARATGAKRGVVVAWVDPAGPAAGRLGVGDVIESVNGEAMSHTRDWDVTSGRLRAGDATLRVRRRGKPIEMQLTVAPTNPSAASPSLGLSLRDIAGVGAAVVGVAPRSAASAAGLQEGDIITLAGDVDAPTSDDMAEVFGSTPSGQAILLAVTRGDAHLVAALVK